MQSKEKERKLRFLDFFDLEEIQTLQDLFSEATGLASIITTPDGTPITRESKFCSYCINVRKTELGLERCKMSDRVLGSPKVHGPRVRRCASCSLYDGGASIMAGDEHIANWLIGQVFDEDLDKSVLIDYANEIGMEDPDILQHIDEITRMSVDKFKKSCDFLYHNAKLLSAQTLDILQKEQEIEKRKQVERLLREEKEQFQVTLASIGDGVIVIDALGDVTYMNVAAHDITQRSIKDSLGKKLKDVLHLVRENEKHDVIDPSEYALKNESKHLINNNTLLICDDGSEKYVSCSVAPMKNEGGELLGVVTVIQDITAHKLKQKEKEANTATLRNQQKLESIGTLASGVAHEINNPINGIMNYSQLILDSDKACEVEKGFASEIVHETQRVSKIVKNLLKFSRKEGKAFSKATIEDLINNTLSLIKTVIKHDQISIDVENIHGLPTIECRSQQIQQVIMNLLTNARDALNEKYDGYDDNKRILISAKEINRNGASLVRIEITDFGPGIPHDIQPKLFEPFFTTKDRTIGTGLGLSISYNIVKEHGGTLNFETKQGEYTKFIVELPIVQVNE